MKSIIASLMVAAFSCQDSIKFLTEEPFKVVCENLKPDSTFSITSLVSDPVYIKPGLDITLVADGIMSEDVKITNIRVDTIQNDVQVFTENNAKDDEVSAGDDYEINYTHGTPSSIPTGKFTTKLTLQAGSVDVAIVACTFTA